MSNIQRTDSIIAKEAYLFALEVIKLYKYVVAEKREFVLSKQLLLSGTSIGANINEAVSGQSKRDFVHKLSLALKVVRETIYWLNLLKGSNFISLPEFNKLNTDCNEIVKILSSIIVTTKEKYFGAIKHHS